MALALSGCYEVEGGAAELSWGLFSYDGDRIDACDEVGVSEIRLCWAPAGEPTTCAAGDSRRFDCEEAHGVTKFELPPGPTSFWIEPVCDGASARADSYAVPPPILREVEDGKVVTLDALLVVTSDPSVESDADCAPGLCGPSATRTCAP